jgi:hypothetical protein
VEGEAGGQRGRTGGLTGGAEVPRRGRPRAPWRPPGRRPSLQAAGWWQAARAGRAAAVRRGRGRAGVAAARRRRTARRAARRGRSQGGLAPWWRGGGGCKEWGRGEAEIASAGGGAGRRAKPKRWSSQPPATSGRSGDSSPPQLTRRAPLSKAASSVRAGKRGGSAPRSGRRAPEREPDRNHVRTGRGRPLNFAATRFARALPPPTKRRRSSLCRFCRVRSLATGSVRKKGLSPQSARGAARRAPSRRRVRAPLTSGRAWANPGAWAPRAWPWARPVAGAGGRRGSAGSEG